jgi:tetratricopeptide (TPR) repeat protein
VLKAIGDVQQFRKETNAALTSYAQALDLFRAVGDRLGEANVLQAIGDVQQFRKETNAALTSYAQALDLFRAVGDRLGEANVYLAIGQLQGEPELFERAITLYRQIGDAYSTARGQYFYALLLLERGEADRAIECLSEARQIWAQMGFETGVKAVDQALARAWSQMIPASVQQPLAAFAAALQAAQASEGDASLWQAAAETGEALLAALESDPPIPALGVEDMRTQLAEVYNMLGNALSESDKTRSLAAYDRAIALLPDEAMLHRNRAGMLITLGRLDEAAAAIETARRLEPDAPRLAELEAQLAAARGAQDRT